MNRLAQGISQKFVPQLRTKIRQISSKSDKNNPDKNNITINVSRIEEKLETVLDHLISTKQQEIRDGRIAGRIITGLIIGIPALVYGLGIY